MVYDFLLCFAREVELVWKKKFSAVTVLFIINRHIYILYAIAGMWLGSGVILDLLVNAAVIIFLVLANTDYLHLDVSSSGRTSRGVNNLFSCSAARWPHTSCTYFKLSFLLASLVSQVISISGDDLHNY